MKIAPPPPPIIDLPTSTVPGNDTREVILSILEIFAMQSTNSCTKFHIVGTLKLHLKVSRKGAAACNSALFIHRKFLAYDVLISSFNNLAIHRRFSAEISKLIFFLAVRIHILAFS